MCAKICQRLHRVRAGFTLIEVATSLAAMSVLMLGLSSAVMIGSRAIPTAIETGNADQTVADAINMFRADLREAETIRYQTSVSGTRVVLGLKDSGGSGVPGNVTYNYLSSTGVIERFFDAEPPTVILSDIDTFELVFRLDGSNVTLVELLLSVNGTLQHFFEMHALLPDRPVRI